MKKTLWTLSALAMLLVAGCLGWQHRDLPQVLLLDEAEQLVFTDADSATRLLARVDTTRLHSERTQALYDLLRALVHEEQWYLLYADTASCLSLAGTRPYTSYKTGKPEEKVSAEWGFRREINYNRADDRAFPDDSTLTRVYNIYERASLGGTGADKEALRRFGRICFVLSRHTGGETPLLQPEKLFHLAIHCAEAAGDHALACRAYYRFAEHLDIYSYNENMAQHWCLRQALEHYRQAPQQASWLLMALNSYGRAFLLRAPCDLHHFPTLARAAAMAARHRDESPGPPEVCGSIYQSLDTLWTQPHDDFGYTLGIRDGRPRQQKEDSTYRDMKDVSVPVDMYEYDQQEHRADTTKHQRPPFAAEMQRTKQSMAIDRDTYLAPGYVQKAAMLQRRLMTAVIIVLVLAVAVLMLVFWNWRSNVRRRHEAEQAAHRREADQMAERLRQKDTMIAMLRGHILDKSEILEMLEPTEGKRTIINARNWREIEATLDTADGGFVNRLRAEHPEFSEDDFRLCMLTRLKLSNTALSAIYLISVSAVQHRKQKLKKEGFGVMDPGVTFDQVIAGY